jgi:hypothetical protein
MARRGRSAIKEGDGVEVRLQGILEYFEIDISIVHNSVKGTEVVGVNP